MSRWDAMLLLNKEVMALHAQVREIHRTMSEGMTNITDLLTKGVKPQMDSQMSGLELIAAKQKEMAELQRQIAIVTDANKLRLQRLDLTITIGCALIGAAATFGAFYAYDANVRMRRFQRKANETFATKADLSALEGVVRAHDTRVASSLTELISVAHRSPALMGGGVH